MTIIQCNVCNKLYDDNNFNNVNFTCEVCLLFKQKKVDK